MCTSQMFKVNFHLRCIEDTTSTAAAIHVVVDICIAAKECRHNSEWIVVGLAFKSAQKTQSQAHTCHLSGGMDFPNFFLLSSTVDFKREKERALVDDQQHTACSKNGN